MSAGILRGILLLPTGLSLGNQRPVGGFIEARNRSFLFPTEPS